MLNEGLRAELLAMAERDKLVRDELVASGELFDGYNQQMESVHLQNAKTLEGIIDQVGWPGISLVKADGAEAAWLILQHAISHPGLQRKCLPLLQTAAKAGEVPPQQAAYLEDRICVFEGRAQRYGTQFDWDSEGVLNPLPLQEPEKVDRYREAIGLRPLSEQIKEVRLQAKVEGDKPPADYEARKEQKEAWARSVGWI